MLCSFVILNQNSCFLKSSIHRCRIHFESFCLQFSGSMDASQIKCRRIRGFKSFAFFQQEFLQPSRLRQSRFLICLFSRRESLEGLISFRICHRHSSSSSGCLFHMFWVRHKSSMLNSLGCLLQQNSRQKVNWASFFAVVQHSLLVVVDSFSLFPNSSAHYQS